MPFSGQGLPSRTSGGTECFDHNFLRKSPRSNAGTDRVESLTKANTGGMFFFDPPQPFILLFGNQDRLLDAATANDHRLAGSHLRARACLAASELPRQEHSASRFHLTVWLKVYLTTLDGPCCNPVFG